MVMALLAMSLIELQAHLDLDLDLDEAKRSKGSQGERREARNTAEWE